MDKFPINSTKIKENDLSKLVNRIVAEANIKGVTIISKVAEIDFFDDQEFKDNQYSLIICPYEDLTDQEKDAVEILSTDVFGKREERHNPKVRESYTDDDNLYITLIKNQKGQVVGFTYNLLYNFEEKTNNFFYGAALNENDRGKGLFPILQNIRLSYGLADVLSTRSKNPKVISSMEKIAKQIGYTYLPNGNEVPDWIKRNVSNLFFGDGPFPEDKIDPVTLVWKKMYFEKGDPNPYDANLIYLVRPGIINPKRKF